MANASARKARIGDLDCIVLVAGDYEAVAVPEIGANLVRLTNTALGMEILRTPDPLNREVLLKNSCIYGTPVLFFPNRITNGRFTVGERTYELPQNEGTNHIHGFLHNRAWELVSFDADAERAQVTMRFSLTESADFFIHYPHRCDFTLCYELRADGLTQHIRIDNHSGAPMPIGLGFHTMFQIPFFKGEDATGYGLRMGIERRWEVVRMIPTEKFMSMGPEERLFMGEGIHPTDQQLDGMVYTVKPLEDGGEMVNGAILVDSRRGVRVVYRWDEKFRFGVIWNGGGNKGFVAAEPQTWTVNAPNISLPDSETGFTLLAPGDAWRAVNHLGVRS